LLLERGIFTKKGFLAMVAAVDQETKKGGKEKL
jgi:hypothetical protein